MKILESSYRIYISQLKYIFSYQYLKHEVMCHPKISIESV
jgi:hypothetical protein